jgi:hypothetical protein
MADVTWVLMPFRNNPTMTLQAVEDCLAQSVPTRVLLIDQGASKADREVVDEAIDKRQDHRVLCFHWNPPLPSLSACWNRALRFVWELGGEEALVVNNDQKCWRHTVELLLATRKETDALFVTPVGVKEKQYTEWLGTDPPPVVDMDNRGGPDFSYFLITKDGHARYPFDEGFVPAFFEDLDSHRRYMIGGDGQRIFSVNIPYLHYASQTIKAYTPEERNKFNQQYARNKQYYIAKWGGDVNAETFLSPFGRDEPAHGGACTTTPDLQRRCLAGLHPYDDTQSAPSASPEPRTPEGESSGAPS